MASVPGSPFEVNTPAIEISPDGRRALIAVRNAGTGDDYIVRDLTTAIGERLG